MEGANVKFGFITPPPPPPLGLVPLSEVRGEVRDSLVHCVAAVWMHASFVQAVPLRRVMVQRAVDEAKCSRPQACW